MTFLRPVTLISVSLLLAASSVQAQTDLLISQYYEGASNNKFIEISNPTAGGISLSGYALTVWSNNAREVWKNDAATLSATSILVLPNVTLNAGQSYLVAHTSAISPGYAVQTANIKTTNSVGFNGDDSVVLYKQTTSPFNTINIVDAFSLKANDAQDKSFRRISNAVGFTLTAGTDSPSLTTVWESTPTVVANGVTDLTNLVATAQAGDTWRLDSWTAGVAPVLNTFVLAKDAASTVSQGVTLDITSSGDNPTEYAVSEDAAFTNAQWLVFTGVGTTSYTLSEPAGSKTIYLKLRNTSGESSTLSDTITYAPAAVTPTVVFTQYYEGTANNKYLEITNLTNDPVDLSTWKLVRWTNADAGLWRITGLTSGGLNTAILLTGSIGAKQSIVLGHTQAALPGVASTQTSGEVSFNGNDTVGLYSGDASPATLQDVLSFTNLGNEGQDKSFRRISTGTGFSFATGLPITQFPAVWEDVPLATVNSASASGDDSNHVGTYYTVTVGYDAWISVAFPGVTDPSIIGFTADPDKDGVANGVEFLLVSDPASPSAVFTDLRATPGGGFTAQHRITTQPANVNLTYKWSTDLTEWRISGDSNTLGDAMSISTSVVSAGVGLNVREVNVSILNGSPRKVFLKMEASR